MNGERDYSGYDDRTLCAGAELTLTQDKAQEQWAALAKELARRLLAATEKIEALQEQVEIAKLLRLRFK